MITTITANPALDRTYLIDDFARDGLHRAAPIEVLPGGKGVNVARALHGLGKPVLACGLLAGLTGRRIAAELERLSLRHDFLWVDGESRLCLSFIDPTTHDHIQVVEPGPALSDTDRLTLCEKAAYWAKESDWLVVGGSPPPGTPDDFCAELLGIARRHGSKTVLDTRDQWLCEGLRSAPDIVKPNRQEFEAVAGECGTVLDLTGRAREWVEAGVGLVVISLDATGALAVNAEGAWLIHAPQVQVLSDVGSGDVLVGGLLAGLSDGWNVPAALQSAVAMAAASAKQAGAALWAPADLAGLRVRTRIERVKP